MTSDTSSALQDPARLAALRATGLLDSPVQPALDRLARLAARLLNAPIAAVSLIDADRRFLASCVGVHESEAAGRETPLSLCQHAVLRREPLVVPDARQEPLLQGRGAAASTSGPVAYAGIPLILSDGQVVGTLCVEDRVPRAWSNEEISTLSDLTASVVTEIELLRELGERRKIQDTLEATEVRLQRQLIESQKLNGIGRLASSISHDFNNYLSAIQATTQLLLMDAEEGTTLWEDLKEIDSAAHRAAALVRQLLSAARRQALPPQPLDLNELIRDLERILRRLAGSEVEVETRLAPDLGTTRMDPSQIEQIIVNLVVNARDAMPAGGRLTISTENAVVTGSGDGVPDGRYVRIRVSDTGTGMESDVKERIFERFYTTKDPEQGTGLGLATVQSILRKSGGHIRVESAPGEGAVFDLLFPVAERQGEG